MLTMRDGSESDHDAWLNDGLTLEVGRAVVSEAHESPTRGVHSLRLLIPGEH